MIMIKKHLLKTILTATVVATVLMTTACGSKQTSDNTTVQQEAVKVVSNVDVKSEADKKESEKKEEADKEQTTEAGETTEETKEEAADNAEQNDEAVAGEINETFEELKEAVNEPQNTAEAPVQEEQAAPAEQPAEAPAENNNAGAVDTTPEEQPAAPAAPAEPSPVPEPTPEPVVTPQEPAKPSVTEEQQLVATGKWTKMYDDIKADDGSIYTYYEYTCPITGYSIEADFKDGTFCRELVNSAEECRAVYNAHGITDTVCSFDRLMKLSNS